MTDVAMSSRTPGTKAMHEHHRASSIAGAGGWLCLAATPTFAVMAVLSAIPGRGPLEVLCGQTQEASPLTGMVAMYVLMSVIHSTPWLKLISRR